MSYLIKSSDQPTEDEWLSNLYEEIENDPESKKILDLLLKRHPPADDDPTTQKEEAATAQKGAKTDEKEEMVILHLPVQALMNTILTDPEINMFFHQMFWQQLQLPDISEGTKIWGWQRLIVGINYIMSRAPEYNKISLVSCPMNALLKWPMATTSGFAAFLNDKVNMLFKDILNYWGNYLKTEDSAKVLNKDPRKGWLGEDAMKAMPNFAEDFICDPSKEHFGFKSWDDFFVRQFRPGRRPVAEPKNDNVIANACESSPYRVARNVQNRDYFWIKSQQYSLDFMLNMDEMAEKFYGGTVYQAYLSPTSYHRWHSPVSGVVMKTQVVDGSYFSQIYNIQNDPASNVLSQGYLCQVAARGIIHIKADNPHIGLICFISVGMVEVSTNEITVKAGDHVKKGDQLGMFHFGGSSHCLIFQPGVNIQFDLGGQTPGADAHNILVRSKIATIIPSLERKGTK